MTGGRQGLLQLYPVGDKCGWAHRGDKEKGLDSGYISNVKPKDFMMN